MSPNLRPYTVEEAEKDIQELKIRAQKALADSIRLASDNLARFILYRDRLERAVLLLERL